MRREMYIERLLTILEAVSDQNMSVSEIVSITGLPKPSVYRQVNDLVDSGLLEPTENGRYKIGLRTKRLSGQHLSDKKLRELAIPLLKTAARTHGATFFLSQLSENAVEIVQAEVPKTGVSYLHPGIGPRPLHACSCAKAIAAFSQNPALHKAMSGRLKSYTVHTKQDLGDLEQEFAQIRRAGFAECVEELESGVCSVAAPVVMADGDIRYSLGATGTIRVLSPESRARFGAVTIALCQDLRALIEDVEDQIAEAG